LLRQRRVERTVGDSQGSSDGGETATKRRLTEKEALAALASSEEQFRLIAQAVTDVVYRVVLDPIVTVDFVSPSVEEVLGVRAEHLQSSPRIILERSHPEDREYALLDTTKHAQTSG